jgi:hypothetical protein
MRDPRLQRTPLSGCSGATTWPYRQSSSRSLVARPCEENHCESADHKRTAPTRPESRLRHDLVLTGGKSVCDIAAQLDECDAEILFGVIRPASRGDSLRHDL